VRIIYSKYSCNILFLIKNSINSGFFFKNSNNMRLFIIRTGNVVSDGFLVDFLQKKTADRLVRSYLIYSGFLLSDRVVYEFLIKIYNNLLFLELNKMCTIECFSPTSILSSLLFYITASYAVSIT